MSFYHEVHEDTKISIKEADLSYQIVGAAMEVHRYWGPGLLESIYQKSLYRELQLRGLKVREQVQVPLLYKDVEVGDSLFIDLLVEDKVVLELKSIKELLPVHEAQLLTYMRLTNATVGYLINFFTPRLKEGLLRRVL